MDTYSFAEILEVITENTLVRISLVVVILIIAQWLSRFVSGIVIRGILKRKLFASEAAREQRCKTLLVVLRRTSATILWVIGFGLVLAQLNFNWTGLVAGAGLIGLVVGLGAQKIAGDFLAGFFILLENQFTIGDIVEVKDMAYGTVERIDLRTTHIRNLDGGLHIIANGDIINMANHSYGWATAVVYLWFDNGSDIAAIEKVMNQVGHDMNKDEVWGKDLKGPLAFDRVDDFGADGLKVRALGNTVPSMQWAVAGEFRKRLRPELDKAGLKLAYPRRVIEKTA